ncbi:MAG: cupredoxin domain-containing protein [Actinobacteria bacterium]|nr:cupredoxin domain-containing protein [Actinomycetota bacterium]
MRKAKRSMVAALAVGASVASFGLIQSVVAPADAAPRPLYGIAEGAKVSILDTGYNPPEVSIKAGEAVTWKNDGQHVHTVTADDGSFDSGPKNPGTEWSYPFQKAGTFSYKCTQDPAMKGTVKVSPPGA